MCTWQQMAGKTVPPYLNEKELMMLDGLWPIELLEDPRRMPRFVSTAEEFLQEVLVGDHLGDFVILPNGVELLGLGEEESLPADIRGAMEGCSSVVDVLRRFQKDDNLLDSYKAGVEYIDAKGEQRGVLPKERRNLRGRVNEVLRLADNAEVDPQQIYIAEVRVQKERTHPIGGDRVKTICSRDVKDVLGPFAAWTLYWDRHDEGVFIGNRLAGKGVHVDQVLWSNVGKNWRGYKLVAAWPKGEVSCRICKDFDDQVFSPPLSEPQIRALKEAAKVVLLRPGDVYVFSGGTAHTVLCASEGLALSGYESICSLHPLHSGLFLQTCDATSPCWMEGAMPEDEFEDILDEALDQLQLVAEQVDKGGPGTLLPNQAPLVKIPQLWTDLQTTLRKNKVVQRLLNEHFATTVALCAARCRYMRKHITSEVWRMQRSITRGSFSRSRSPARGRSRSKRRPPAKADCAASP